MRAFAILSLLLLCRISVSQEMPKDAVECLKSYRSEVKKAKKEYENKIKQAEQKAIIRLKEIQKEEMKNYRLATANAIQREIDELEGKELKPPKAGTARKTTNPNKKTESKPERKPIYLTTVTIQATSRSKQTAYFRGRRLILLKGNTIVLVPEGKWRSGPTMRYHDYRGHLQQGWLRLQYSIGKQEGFVQKDQKIEVQHNGTLELFHNDEGTRNNDGAIKVKIYLVRKSK